MEDGRQPLELTPADPGSLGFATTAELPAPKGMVGQERAQESIDFALEMNDSRYNLFVNGDPGTGRRIAVATAVEALAKSRPAAKDWCYVYRFDQPEEPHAVALPPGMMSPPSSRPRGASCGRLFPATPTPPNARSC